MNIQPKERPILFSGEMARAILDGRKKMTRRIVKVQPDGHHWERIPGYQHRSSVLPTQRGLEARISHWLQNEEDGVQWIKCPYGQPGDRLWVRETFFDHNFDGEKDVEMIEYRASEWERDGDGGGWSPSIHMPRWASRITLEITGVRVERLQDISEADAMAEGVESLDFHREDFNPAICPQCGGTRLYTAHSLAGAAFDMDCLECDTYVKRFRNLWNEINGERASWASNPWVWVIEFCRAPC